MQLNHSSSTKEIRLNLRSSALESEDLVDLIIDLWCDFWDDVQSTEILNDLLGFGCTDDHR